MILENKSSEIDVNWNLSAGHTPLAETRRMLFQSPFQEYHWSRADALFADTDYTGNDHFPYLLTWYVSTASPNLTWHVVEV